MAEIILKHGSRSSKDIRHEVKKYLDEQFERLSLGKVSYFVVCLSVLELMNSCASGHNRSHSIPSTGARSLTTGTLHHYNLVSSEPEKTLFGPS